jgi:hypothetical protein
MKEFLIGIGITIVVNLILMGLMLKVKIDFRVLAAIYVLILIGVWIFGGWKIGLGYMIGGVLISLLIKKKKGA